MKMTHFVALEASFITDFYLSIPTYTTSTFYLKDLD